MVVTDFECDLFPAGYIQVSTQPDAAKDESNSHDRGNNWHLLFPEVVQNINSSNAANISQVDNNNNVRQRYGIHPNKQFSISDSSSDDIILIDYNLMGSGEEPSTSTEPLPMELADYVYARLESDSIPSSFANLFGQKEHEHEHTGHSTAKTSLSSEGSSEYPMHNPSVQVMNKNEQNYDPQRIPSSVFQRCDSLIPAEWSATSNESLFSLHLDTSSSIGREQALLLNGELKIPGGLFPKSREEVATENLQEIRKLVGLSTAGDDQHNVSTSTTTLSGVTNDGKVDHEENKTNKNVVLAVDQMDEDVAKVEGDKHEQQNIHSSSISFHSNASEDSNYSFVFPVFGEVGKNSMKKGHHQQQQLDINNQNTAPQLGAPKHKGFFSSFHIFSWNSCISCNSCSSCVSCSYFTSCFKSRSCLSCASCFSCASCKACWGYLSKK